MPLAVIELEALYLQTNQVGSVKPPGLSIQSLRKSHESDTNADFTPLDLLFAWSIQLFVGASLQFCCFV